MSTATNTATPPQCERDGCGHSIYSHAQKEGMPVGLCILNGCKCNAFSPRTMTKPGKYTWRRAPANRTER